ncbi:MAG: glycosyltransferase family 4 protein [Saccharofermentans sp.]|nr:glycosyltransferase family 4 protein [Saccharofermentans sp.]
MKLAILTCGILPIPAVQGGAVENMIDFYLEYNNRKRLHDITIYSPWDSKAAQHTALDSDVNHYHFIDVTSFKARVKRRLYKYFHSGEYYNHFVEYYFEKIYAHLKKQHYDYIILENCPGHALKLSRRGHKNIILHLNNNLLNSESRFHDEIFSGLASVLTCSNFIKDCVLTIQPNSSKVRTHYNAIDIAAFIHKQPDDPLGSAACYQRNARNTKRAEARKQMGFAIDDFVIAFSGRVNSDKGISELIDTMLLLKDKEKIKLMVIGGSFFGNANGDDDFIKSLKDKAETLKDRIVFTGFIPYKDMPDYLHLADMAALPSMWDEPFGLTIVEALAAGLPLVTTRSGGIPEICEGVATIVDRKDIVNNLAKAILDLYEHPEKRKQMAEASPKRAELFDKEPYSEKFFAALENLEK